jgi:phosphohistidine phosphatase
MRVVAVGLHRLVNDIDVLATSPLARTLQTAEIVAAEFGGLDVMQIEELRPGTPPADFVEWIQDAGAKETVAIVGHETQLSELVGLLLSGRPEPLVVMKKGGALLLDLDDRAPGGGKLLWSLTPGQLRMLGG